MFTRCPECGTLFRVSAGMLAAAQGDVRCGRCNTEFNALGYLRDDPTATEDGADEVEAVTTPPPATPGPPITESPPEGSQPGAPPATSLEFDVPEGQWSQFFDDTHGLPAVEDAAAERSPPPGAEFEIRSLSSDEDRPDSSAGVVRLGTLEDETSDTDTWQAFLREVPLEDDEEQEAPVVVIEESRADQTVEMRVVDEMPPETPATLEPADGTEPELPPARREDTYPSVLQWGERPGPEPEPRRHTALWAFGCVVLLLVLGAQLIHSNRDTLATDPQIGPAVRDVYARLGIALYPSWPLASYEIRGAEAIAGRTASGALDVVADIAMIGSQPVAAPLVRIVLRDRWSNIVGSRVLKPVEYSRDAQLRAKLLTPGTLVPVQISLADPGASAQGYELDLCVPDRRNGLRCQLAHDPYRH